MSHDGSAGCGRDHESVRLKGNLWTLWESELLVRDEFLSSTPWPATRLEGAPSCWRLPISTKPGCKRLLTCIPFHSPPAIIAACSIEMISMSSSYARPQCYTSA